MKIFLSLLLFLTYRVQAQDDLYKHMKFIDNELVFSVDMESNIAPEDIVTRMETIFCFDYSRTKNDTIYGRIIKCYIPLKEYRGEEFGASAQVRSPFDGLVKIFRVGDKYRFIASHITFETTGATMTSHARSRIAVTLTDWATKSNGKLIRIPYLVKDVRAIQAYLYDQASNLLNSNPQPQAGQD